MPSLDRVALHCPRGYVHTIGASYNRARAGRDMMKKTKWQLQEAQDRLSEVVRRAREEGPQTITLQGDDAVVRAPMNGNLESVRSPA